MDFTVVIVRVFFVIDELYNQDLIPFNQFLPKKYFLLRHKLQLDLLNLKNGFALGADLLKVCHLHAILIRSNRYWQVPQIIFFANHHGLISENKPWEPNFFAYLAVTRICYKRLAKIYFIANLGYILDPESLNMYLLN